jgi:hypothetical protein
MAYPANVLRVLISSPGDVPEERQIVTEELHRWNDANSERRNIVLRPIKWETSTRPNLGMPAQAVISKQIADSADILVGIFGSRIGTPTERHPSGTVEEIHNHEKAEKPVMVYFSDAPIEREKLDQDQYNALLKFRAECQTRGLYDTYKDTVQFRHKFSQHLSLELNDERYQHLAILSPLTQPPTEISADALYLLNMVVHGKVAHEPEQIIVLGGVDGDRIVAGGNTLTDATGRSLAHWRRAVTELERYGYTKKHTDRLPSGVTLYDVTDLGYHAADAAEAAKPTRISAKIVGQPVQQRLEIEASKTITLKKIDYLNSTGTCITSQVVEQTGQTLSVEFDQSKLSELWSPRKRSDLAKLRIIFEANGRLQVMVLSTNLQPGNLTLIGSAETEVR